MSKANEVLASEIALFLNSPLCGRDFTVSKVTSLKQAAAGSLVFSKNKVFELSSEIQCLVLCPEEPDITDAQYSYIKVKNPRLAFAKVLNRFFFCRADPGIHPSTIVGSNCVIAKSVSIGAHCVIGDDVTIGENTIINNHVVLYKNTKIGDDCYIKSGAVIGEEGFGFAFEDDKTPVRIPHLGNVIIGNNVEVGAHTTVARGTLGPTKICDFVKLDDQVFIAHNCMIGKNTVVIAFAEISGSVTIGENCWIGPHSAIINNITIGDNVTIGIGSVITGSVDSCKKVMCLESIELRSLLKLKKRIDYGA